VVAAARAWIGTPYVHQASCRGAGTDCLGLVRGVWRALYGAEPEVPPAYTPDWGEGGGRELLAAAAGRWLVPAGVPAPGDVILFRMRDGSVAKHLGIAVAVGAGARFVHAYSGQGVVESPLSAPWARRVAARFVFPEGVH
jgi:NlpC/P60 family putative phage cell wall peptidase